MPDNDGGGDVAPNEVDAKLTELGVDADIIAQIKDKLGAETLADLAVLEERDLVGLGMKVVQARSLINSFAPKASAADTAAISAANYDVLPTVPDDSSWLEALKTGGVLKVDQSTVISAIRAALASKVGLYSLPDKLVVAMENFADTNDEQVDPEFFKLRKQLRRRSYAEVFEAIDGLDGTFVTEERRKELFRKINDSAWPAILSFYSQLKGWQDAWMQGANPMAIMAVAISGPGASVLPAGLMQPPDTGVLRDSADSVNDAFNRVFAGTGIQITAALAYEASQIRQTMENPRLPQMIGAANRDQMLKMLKVAVSANYPRLETNITRFVLGILGLKDQPGGNDELQYLSALYMLGSQITWDQLGEGHEGFSAIGGRTRL